MSSEIIKHDQWHLLCYTRSPLDADVYSPKLAYSMHLAISPDGKHYEALNDHSGVLFATATERADGSLCAKSLKNPFIFQLRDDRYGVIAKRIEAEGAQEQSSIGAVIVYVTSNFYEYEEIGLLQLSMEHEVEDFICTYDEKQEQYVITWCDQRGRYYESVTPDIMLPSVQPLKVASQVDASQLKLSKIWGINGIEERNSMIIPIHIGAELLRKLGRMFNVAVVVPQNVTASSVEELNKVKANVIYSDGSTSNKNVVWDTSYVNWNNAGTYTLQGKVQQSYAKFPIAVNRADPNIFRWNGSYYFIATDDTTPGNLRFFARKAERIEDIEHAEEHLILDHEMYEDMKVHLWAPEFHCIDNQLYVLFACSSGEFIHIRCYMMKLQQDGDPLQAKHWERPIAMLKQDGTPLYDKGITLDMTYVEVDGGHYVIWAQRQFIPVDAGSWLYIAEIDPACPWQLISEPIVISKPDYGWANNQTFVDEGPYAIVKEDKVYVTFSSALVNATYCVGLLMIKRGANMLDAASWKKRNYPLLTSRSIDGEFGPGHNSYVVDAEGNLLNVYHARPGLEGPRCTGIRQVHFGYDGEPILKMNVDQQLDEKRSIVTTTLIVT